mgnify:CR=1 FL=1
MSTELSEIVEELNKQYGDIIIPGGRLVEKSGNYISTGLLGMDIALNGGIREGTWVHIGSLPKTGKTSFCLNIVASAQKMGKNVYFVDVEGRLQTELLDCIDGLNKDTLKVIKSGEDKILSAEDYLSIIEKLLKDDPGCVVILDSLAVLCPEVELASEMNEMQRATVPKLMYKFLRKISPMLSTAKSTFISITHLQANPSGYGSPFKEVGGYASNYGASYWLMGISSSKVEGPDGKQIGKDTKFRIMATASGPPDAEPIVPVRYGRGCDKYVDMARISEEMGFIKKAGAWFEVQLPELKKEGKLPKLQGEAKLVKYLEETPEAFELLNSTIRDLVFAKKEKKEKKGN